MGIRNQSQARDAHIWTLRMAMVMLTLLCLAEAAVIFIARIALSCRYRRT